MITIITRNDKYQLKEIKKMHSLKIKTMITGTLIIAGALGFLLFFKTINFFEKI